MDSAISAPEPSDLRTVGAPGTGPFAPDDPEPLAPEPPWLDATRRRLAERGLEDVDATGALGRALDAEQVAATPATVRYLEDELTGFGPLAPWVRAEGITDVLVDAAGQVWTDGIGGLRSTGLRLPPERASALATRLLAQAGRRLDAAVPAADARVAGVRVHAVLPPISGGGPVLSLRVPAADRPALGELAAGWPDGATWLDAMRLLIRRRASVLVSGATGSGKTTLLTAALAEVPPDERIVTVEDTLEATPAHPHVVPLQARAANVEGAGEIGLAELIRHALRMRPDRLVVGECRGAEVAEMLTALNTGHQGAWGTLHANSAHDVPARLHAMGALAGWSRAAIDAQARAGVDAVVHVRRRTGTRAPTQLCVPVPADAPDAPLTLAPALTDDGSGRAVRGPGWPLLTARLGDHDD